MNHNCGTCYWITGLSASGKTTLSSALAAQFRAKSVPVVVLDGDVMRGLFVEHAYAREDRVNLAYKYSSLAQMITNQGIHVIVAVIGLFSEIHKWNRSRIRIYREVFLDVPKEELVRRDPKGIYKKFRDGELSNVVGFDIEVDFPATPEFHFKWSPEQKVGDLTSILMEDFLAHNSG